MQISFDAVVLTDDPQAREFFTFNDVACLWVDDLNKSINLAKNLAFEYVVLLSQNANYQDTFKMLGLMNDYDLVIANNWEWSKYLSGYRVYRTSLLDQLNNSTDLSKAVKFGAKVGFIKTSKPMFQLNLKNLIVETAKILFVESPKTLESSLY